MHKWETKLPEHFYFHCRVTWIKRPKLQQKSYRLDVQGVLQSTFLVDSDGGVLYRFFDLPVPRYSQVSGFDFGQMSHVYTACNSYIGSSSFISNINKHSVKCGILSFFLKVGIYKHDLIMNESSK